MKRLLLLTLFATLATTAFSQTHYTFVDEEIIGRDPSGAIIDKGRTWFFSTSEYAIYSFANIWQQSVNNKEKQAQMERDKAQAVSKLAIIKENYNAQPNLPDTIKNGWHKAIATDSYTFCKEVKVLVDSNRIKKFVIDNCVPLDFTPLSGIKKAKSTLSISHTGGQQTLLVDVYFIFDMEQPLIVEAPIKAGYLCFWTNAYNYDGMQIFLNGERIENLTRSFDTEPEPFTQGTVCRILPPGTYHFKVLRRGTDWEGDVIVKSGMCVRYQL